MIHDDRSTPIGFFNYGDSFWLGGEALAGISIGTTHPGAPVDFLHHHAIELYLKADLRNRGYSAEKLRSREFGHKVGALARECAKCGLDIPKTDIEALEFVEETGAAFDARYIRTGFRNVIELETLAAICERIRTLVASEMTKANYPVRPPDVLRRGRRSQA